MRYTPFILLSSILLAGCSGSVPEPARRSEMPCANKPNCVSTQDSREDYALAPFVLTPVGADSFAQIVSLAADLKGAKVVDQDDQYARLEFTSKLFRFVDDVDIEMKGEQLIVRSESRKGYSDLGVNRERTDELRALWTVAGFIQPPASQ